MSDFDLCVIGSGPAGQRAAIQAAKLGKRAVVVEKRDVVGGVAVNTGTIPSKALREAMEKRGDAPNRLSNNGRPESGLTPMQEYELATQKRRLGQDL